MECEYCKTEFQPKDACKPMRFCCKWCCDKYSYENCDRPKCICKACGKAFTPKAANRTTVCSRECVWRLRAIKAERVRNAKQTAKRLRQLFANLRQCQRCKAAFVGKGKQVFCSDECRSTPASPTCELCGKPSEPTGKYKSSRCASCRKELKKLSAKRGRWRRDRKRLQTNATATYKSKELLVLLRGLVRRTKGQCKLCGLALSKRIGPNNDRALEFDHKVPLCVGGPDTIGNLQAICRRCNGLKSTFTAPDVVIGEWMTNDKDLRSDTTAMHYTPTGGGQIISK